MDSNKISINQAKKMKTCIKNLRYLKGIFSDSDLEKLEYGAQLHLRHARITFKVMSSFSPKKEITIEVRQDKNPTGNQFDVKVLVTRTRELFEPFLPEGWKLFVNAVPYEPPASQVVTPGWMSRQMEELGIKASTLAKETGTTKSEVSHWLSGSKELSQIAKSMIYYYFQSKKLEGAKKRK